MIDDATRMRLFPAVRVFATGEVKIGKRGEMHGLVAAGCEFGGHGVIYERGWFDIRTREFLSADTVDSIHDPNETEVTRTLREMRGAP